MSRHVNIDKETGHPMTTEPCATCDGNGGGTCPQCNPSLLIKECSNSEVLSPGLYRISGFEFSRYDFDVIEVAYSLMSSCKGTSEKLPAMEAWVRFHFIQCRIEDWQPTKVPCNVEGYLCRWLSSVVSLYLLNDFYIDLKYIRQNMKESEREMVSIRAKINERQRKNIRGDSKR